MIFSKQLSSLMDMLSGTKPYFIRCIKPNSEKVANNFDWEYVRPQLRCQGLVEALRILKCGYPTRTTYELIYDRYGSILNPAPSNLNKRDFCEAILRVCGDGLSRNEFELGLTKVFFRPGQAEYLENLLNNQQELSAKTIALIKLFLLHKRFQRAKGTIFVHIAFANLIRQKRARKKWNQLLTISKAINKLCYKPLRRIRTYNAIELLTGFIHTKMIQKKFKLIKSNYINISIYLHHKIRSNIIKNKLNILQQKRIEEIKKAKADELKEKELELREKRRQEQLAFIKKQQEEKEAKIKAEQERLQKLKEQAALMEAKKEQEEKLKLQIKNQLINEFANENKKDDQNIQLENKLKAEYEKTNFALNKYNELNKKYLQICEIIGINEDDDIIYNLKSWQEKYAEETQKRIIAEESINELETQLQIVKAQLTTTNDNDDNDKDLSSIKNQNDIILDLHKQIKILKQTIQEYEEAEQSNINQSTDQEEGIIVAKLDDDDDDDDEDLLNESNVDQSFNISIDIDPKKIKLTTMERALNQELARQRKRAIQAQLESSKIMKWAVKFSSDYKRRPSIAKIHEQLKIADRDVRAEEINVSNCLNELELYEQKLREAGKRQKQLKEAYAYKNLNQLNDKDKLALHKAKLDIKTAAINKMEAAKKLQQLMDLHAKKIAIRDKLRIDRENKLVSSATKKVPDIEKGREFFMMTAISILKGIEEEGLIGSAKRESAWVFRLFEIALLEDIPFYHWSDWLNERIRRNY